jgi:hypothetical protein
VSKHKLLYGKASADLRLVPGDSAGVVTVRDVISPDGSSDRFSDLRRALIGGACRFVAVGPISRSAI